MIVSIFWFQSPGSRGFSLNFGFFVPETDDVLNTFQSPGSRGFSLNVYFAFSVSATFYAFQSPGSRGFSLNIVAGVAAGQLYLLSGFNPLEVGASV